MPDATAPKPRKKKVYKSTLNRTMPTPAEEDSVRLTIRVDKEIAEKMRLVAIRDRRTYTDINRAALTLYLDGVTL